MTRNKFGFTQKQLRPGFGRFVPDSVLRAFGYRLEYGRTVPAYLRFEVFQRVEYEAVMGRPPKLATAEEMARFNSLASA